MKKFLTFYFTFFVMSFSFCNALDLTISQYPTNPKQGESVKYTLDSDKYNLNIANIVWTVDDAEVDSGIGRKTLNVTTPTNGKTQIVIVKVSQDGFDDAQTQAYLEANTNFLLYEGVDSYVPSFYKGRRLPAREGTARVGFFSFKDGEITGFKQNTVENYYWKVNGEDKVNLSGQNKIVNQIISHATDNALSIQTIKENLSGDRKQNEVNIPLQGTETILYKTDEKKLTRQPISDTEYGKNLFVFVEPFFFSVKKRSDPDLLYNWKINDIVQALTTPWSVVFAGNVADSVKINLTLSNNKKITQDSERGFTFKVQ